MIISTIPLEKKDLPCIVVRSAMLNTDDILDIQKKAFEVMNSANAPEASSKFDVINPEEIQIQGAFYEWLSEDRVDVDYEADDWKDAVRHAGELLYQAGAIELRYIDAMIQKIETYLNYFFKSSESCQHKLRRSTSSLTHQCNFNLIMSEIFYLFFFKHRCKI